MRSSGATAGHQCRYVPDASTRCPGISSASLHSPASSGGRRTGLGALRTRLDASPISPLRKQSPTVPWQFSGSMLGGRGRQGPRGPGKGRILAPLPTALALLVMAGLIWSSTRRSSQASVRQGRDKQRRLDGGRDQAEVWPSVPVLASAVDSLPSSLLLFPVACSSRAARRRLLLTT